MPIPFVGQRMTREEFAAHLKSLKFKSFKPRFVTMHHTATPNLSQRPNGFSRQHLLNLKSYYEGMGWNGAPHIFIDDVNDGIIVFQRMDRRGTHAASFNSNSWGLESLGYYDIGGDSFTTGRGAKVRENTLHAIAIMCEALGVKADTLKFHRDDPKTKKTCPGTAITKQSIVSAVNAILNQPAPSDTVAPIAPIVKDEVQTQGFIVKVSRAGHPEVSINASKENGRAIVPARRFFNLVHPIHQLGMRGGSVVFIDQSLTEHTLPLADIDDNGSSWVFVRDAATALGLKIEVKGSEILLS